MTDVALLRGLRERRYRVLKLSLVLGEGSRNWFKCGCAVLEVRKGGEMEMVWQYFVDRI